MQNLFAFLVPLLSPIEFSIVGRLFLPELLLLVGLIFLAPIRVASFSIPRAKVFIVLALTWLVAQVVSDFVVGSPSSDYLRGWAKISFMLLNFCAILAMTQARLQMLSVFAFGVALGSILTHIVRPAEYALSDPWKFGYGWGITFLAVLLAGGLSSEKKQSGSSLQMLVLIAMSAINIALGFRSLGGICAIAAVVAATAPRFRRGAQAETRRRRRRRMLSFAGALLVAVFGLSVAYQYTAQSGLLGEQAREKYETQGLGEYGVLIGGRTELLVSLDAISESPIVGHGSWARDPKYALLLPQIRAELGYEDLGESELDLIPTHSHLFGAWVEAGLLGAVFWIWVFGVATTALLSLGSVPPAHRPWVAFVLVNLLWDILFSPFGAERRFITPFFIITAIAVHALVPTPKTTIKTVPLTASA